VTLIAHSVRTVNVPGCTVTIDTDGLVIAITDGYVNEPARLIGVMHDRADGDGVVATSTRRETRDLTSVRHAVLWLLGEEAALA